MQRTFHRIALIGKPDAEHIAETLPSLYTHLLRRGCDVVVESGCAQFLSGSPQTRDLSELGARCELAIVVGGDGTLLTAARVLADQDIPLIGVNLGRLGFLVDISPQEALAKLDEILDGHYSAEERNILRSKILRGDRVIREQTAVNEVVIHSWSATSMIEIVTEIDGVFLNCQRSDGLIVSTPTGSTAYALSGGGPILYPTLKAIVLVPINPHTLTNRPIVIADDSVVEITFRPSKQFKAQVACDNVSIPDVEIHDRIRIAKEPRPFRILHPLNYGFFEILRAKLNWSSGYRN
jgi:NAD+ kinase